MGRVESGPYLASYHQHHCSLPGWRVGGVRQQQGWHCANALTEPIRCFHWDICQPCLSSAISHPLPVKDVTVEFGERAQQMVLYEKVKMKRENSKWVTVATILCCCWMNVNSQNIWWVLIRPLECLISQITIFNQNQILWEYEWHVNTKSWSQLHLAGG